MYAHRVWVVRLTFVLAACGGPIEDMGKLSAPRGMAEFLPDQLPLPRIESMSMEVLGSPSDIYPVFGIKVCNHTDHATLPVELHTFFSVGQRPEEFAQLLAGDELPEADTISELDPLKTRTEQAEILEDGELPCRIAVIDIGGRDLTRYKIREGAHQAWAVLVLSPGYVLPGAWHLAYSDIQLGETYHGTPRGPLPQ